MLDDTYFSPLIFVDCKSKGIRGKFTFSYRVIARYNFFTLSFASFLIFFFFFFSFLFLLFYTTYWWKLIIRTTWRSLHAHRYNSIESTGYNFVFTLIRRLLINDFVLDRATLFFFGLFFFFLLFSFLFSFLLARDGKMEAKNAARWMNRLYFYLLWQCIYRYRYTDNFYNVFFCFFYRIKYDLLLVYWNYSCSSVSRQIQMNKY